MADNTLSIGLGTAAIGRPQYINIRNDQPGHFSLDSFRKQGNQVLNAAYNHGIRYFDTAPGYGLAEELLLEWVLKKEDKSIEVGTKWGYTYTANFEASATRHEVKEHSLSKLKEQWIFSKKLLPYLSTYQIHSATLDTQVLDNEEVLHFLAVLKRDYAILMGITTSGSNQVEVIKKALDVEIDGIQLFDAFQVTFNVLERQLGSIATELKKQNKRIIIKEALANGRLFPNEKYSHYSRVYKFLKVLAKKYKVGIDAIAMRYCIDKIHPYKVLSGASNILHVQENIEAGTFKLESDEVAELHAFQISSKHYWEERKKMQWN